jgi:hypothetical protein
LPRENNPFLGKLGFLFLPCLASTEEKGGEKSEVGISALEGFQEGKALQ